MNKGDNTILKKYRGTHICERHEIIYFLSYIYGLFEVNEINIWIWINASFG